MSTPSPCALPTALIDQLGDRSVVVLTGAGISAPSGIPTFRGPGGYWTVGSTVYRAHEISTRPVLLSRPWDVWGWYLYRRGVCDAAEPNAAHRALVALEQGLGDRFTLITQNIDGLHLRAGNSPERTLEVHGAGRLMRCLADCTTERFPIPAEVGGVVDGDQVREEDKALLRCPRCGALARPHVLLWDEYYEEALYRSDSAMAAVKRCGLFITIGTTGSTSLPVRAAAVARQRGAVVLDLNTDDNDFAEDAERYARGAAVRGDAEACVPRLVEAILAAAG